MSDIPRARDILAALIERLSELGDAESEALASSALSLMTRRRYAKPAAPVTSRTVDRELAARIRAFVKANPEMSQQEVGEHFGTNHGRVSEALHRDR